MNNPDKPKPSLESEADPYRRDPNFSLDPPKSLGGMIRYFGPGLILTASVVGSGELIATTSLGAKVGFVALWLILVSCVIKVAVQLIIGRYAIFSGETTLQFMNELPGPRLRASWFIWCHFLMLMMVNFQQGAMLGGVGQVLHLVAPQFSVTAWALLTAVVTILLLIGGRYRLIENGSTALVAIFTLTTLLCVGLLQRTGYSVSAADLWSGLKFDLPTGGVAIAVAVFGITGIGTNELIFYPYWCIEKGYARAVGVRDDSGAWHARAQGWIRTMNWDALCAMIIYTVTTLAFFVLGASVLHSAKVLPEGMEMIQTLSKMYTEVLGVGAFYLFLVGAFAVLYSTIFVSVAGNARMFVDCLSLMGVIRVKDYADRKRWIRVLVVVQPLFHFLLFLAFKLPLWMVVVGGMAQTVMLPVVASAALYLRHRRLDPKLAPARSLDFLLWISWAVIVTITLYGLGIQIADWLTPTTPSSDTL
jgi:Mn2+/Fe2+ NRAMP family transporter